MRTFTLLATPSVHSIDAAYYFAAYVQMDIKWTLI